jgi:hypothetical protein
MNKQEFEKVFAAAAEKSGVAELARKNQFAENLEAMMCELRDKLNSLPAEQPSEDLEKVSKNYADNEEYGDDAYFAIKAAFKAGANWQKEQMMESAIDAIVDEETDNSYLKTLVFIGEQRDALDTRISNYEFGEMVKVIIIKEDEQ